MVDLQEQTADRGGANYRSSLHSAIRGLWSGAMDDIQAFEVFMLSIRDGFTRAYRDGSAEVGIVPADWTVQERQWLEQKTREEIGFIDGFLNAIIAGSKANGGKLAPLFNRAELWVQRYLEVYTQGMLTAKTDPKLLWVWDPAAEHCPSCAALQGKIKRQSQWQAAGLYPQAPVLACMQSAGGITVCKCHFEVTTDPATRGPLPRI